MVANHYRHLRETLGEPRKSPPFSLTAIEQASKWPSSEIIAAAPTAPHTSQSAPAAIPTASHIKPINIYTRYDTPLKQLQNLAVWRFPGVFKLLQVMASAEIDIGSICRHIRLAPVVGRSTPRRTLWRRVRRQSPCISDYLLYNPFSLNELRDVN